MSTPVNIQLAYKDSAWFAANPTLTLLAGQIVYLDDQSCKYKLGDGVTTLDTLPWRGIIGVQSVTGTNVDNTDPLNPVVEQLGLIQIIDKDGDFFTDLATATAYIEQFFTDPTIITDKSFKEGIFFFTVPENTSMDVNLTFLSNLDGVTFNTASFIDNFGLITSFLGASSFQLTNGKFIFGGDVEFMDYCFYNSNAYVEINNLKSTLGADYLFSDSNATVKIFGNIGENETANFGIDFFNASTSTVLVNASKYTSNAGGIHGDLQRAIINGCNVFFDGIDKEDKRNKGVANGYVPLNSSAKIDSTYLPSYVDDVVEGYLLSNVFYEESSHITVIAASTGKIYIDLTAGQKNKEYRYSGSIYVQITNGLIATTDDVVEGSSNLYFTVARVLATALTGINTALTGVIISSDTILTAFGRIQNQITTISTALSNYVTLTGTETLTNKTIKKRILVVTQSATPSTNIDNGDIIQITGLAQAITSMTTNLTGTPYDGQMIMWQITDNGTARAITWGTSFASTTGATLPTTTVISTMLRVITQYNLATSKHECQYVN